MTFRRPSRRAVPSGPNQLKRNARRSGGGPFFWAMSITTQLCTAGSEASVGNCIPRHPAARSGFTMSPARKPHKLASDCMHGRFLVIACPDPLRPIGLTEAGVATRDFPCPGAGRLASLPGFPGLPAAHHRRRIRNFRSSSTSLCSLRVTGLAERRLECKEKMNVRVPENRLRADGRNPTAARLREGHDGRSETSNACRRKSQSLDGQKHELARELLARRYPHDQQRIDIGAGDVQRQTAGFSATRSSGSTCTPLLVAPSHLPQPRSRNSEDSAAICALAAPGAMP